uniref:Uncharacterized protein n=1 Tax=Leersia perrieri TaxID=77586 RepID=A0A0D9VJQ4_9ORYZ
MAAYDSVVSPKAVCLTFCRVPKYGRRLELLLTVVARGRCWYGELVSGGGWGTLCIVTCRCVRSHTGACGMGGRHVFGLLSRARVKDAARRRYLLEEVSHWAYMVARLGLGLPRGREADAEPSRAVPCDAA